MRRFAGVSRIRTGHDGLSPRAGLLGFPPLAAFPGGDVVGALAWLAVGGAGLAADGQALGATAQAVGQVGDALAEGSHPRRAADVKSAGRALLDAVAGLRGAVLALTEPSRRVRPKR